MLVKKNNFYLDRVENPDIRFNDKLLIGTTIDNENVIIAYVCWDEAKNTAFIRTNADNLQTYIVYEDQYKDFIYLIDEAFFLIDLLRLPLEFLYFYFTNSWR